MRFGVQDNKWKDLLYRLCQLGYNHKLMLSSIIGDLVRSHTRQTPKDVCLYICKMIVRLGIGKKKFYNVILRPLWNYGLIVIDIKEWWKNPNNELVNRNCDNFLFVSLFISSYNIKVIKSLTISQIPLAYNLSRRFSIKNVVEFYWKW